MYKRQGEWDARYETPLYRSGIVDGVPIDDLGIPGSRIITPGNPEASVMWHRVSRWDGRHMPPLATSELNLEGMDLMRRFIDAVTLPPARALWMVGINDDPSVAPYTPYAEFAKENGMDDVPPGGVTRLPGDPQYVQSLNPPPDDDFYFAGNYPAGFNGLYAPLGVPNDEPSDAWERALTHSGRGDRTNRFHFVLDASQAVPGSKLRLGFEFIGGGAYSCLLYTSPSPRD